MSQHNVWSWLKSNFSFKKKIKIGRPEHTLTLHSPTSDNISFLTYPPPPRKAGVICVSPLKPVTLITEATEPKLQTPFIAALLPFFLEMFWVNVLSRSCECQIPKNYAAKLCYYRQGKHLKIMYLSRYSHVLYRITTFEKSERFHSLH